jgi:putative endonuclease
MTKGDGRESAGWRQTLRALERRLLGSQGERLASRHLKRQGMRILARGVRAGLGEIDLIAREGPTLVFVEVKTRRAGEPAEAVTDEKQRRLTMSALHFAKRHGLLEVPSRFDVVAIVWPDDGSAPEVKHYRDAFPPVGRGQFFR